MNRLFEEHIKKSNLFGKQDKLLLAISGGVDSVVLALLLTKGGFHFDLAHCNFKLRGKDSDADEKFCIKLAKELGVDIKTKAFDVKVYCKSHKQSIQMAARELRYNWFNELIQAGSYDYLLTAHHAGDQVETFFINLLRGTGINGLKGIRDKHNQIVRPLLPFKKAMLIEYSKEHNIKHRTDISNLNDKYERNFIRLNIIPKLKELEPAFEEVMIGNILRLKEESEIVKDYLSAKADNMITRVNNTVRLDKDKIKNERSKGSLLNFILEPYGFNSTQQSNIVSNLNQGATVGKNFISGEYRLTIDRKYIVIEPLKEKTNFLITVNSPEEFKKVDFIKIKKIRSFSLPAKNELLLDQERLQYPLLIRNPQTGDRFKPFGMKNSKLLSDFFKDEKLNAFEKENCRLLVNGNGEIIWVMGYRSDDRYKVEKDTISLLKISIE